MPANHKKPHSEIPEEELAEQLATDDNDDEQPIQPKTSKPATVSEADWVDQNIDVPIDDDDIEHS
ncbi:hypothetical protein [Enteractinococcus helveticum]|uniref:Uncharacterized protein n=1 Tax=Enteractinococcus helveticum TaxID=1837282 RepID=A0A1B7M063_9MICC|nr:hypothetical protein [Enteractinococcus helveticum]OAV61472.1 hypothetical protein A6F49_08480 [Enteractinococcus helveticum]